MPARQSEDEGSDLTRWLEDSGHRRAMRLQDSPEALIACLEKLSGRKLQSRDDVLLLYQQLTGDLEAKKKSERMRRIRREALFLGLLVAALGQYYYGDVFLQIGGLHNNHYFIKR